MSLEIQEAVTKYINYVEKEKQIKRISKLAKSEEEFRGFSETLKNGKGKTEAELEFILQVKREHFNQLQVSDRQEYEILYYEGILNSFTRTELASPDFDYDQFLTDYMMHFMLWNDKLAVPKNNPILRRIASYQRTAYKKGELNDTHYSILLDRLILKMRRRSTLIREIELAYEKENPFPFDRFEDKNDFEKILVEYREKILALEYIYNPKTAIPPDIKKYSEYLKDPYRRLVWGVDTMKELTYQALQSIKDLNLYLSPDFAKSIDKYLET